MFSLHVADDELMDVLDGTARDRALAHVSGCAPCRARVDEARGGLALAVQAEVPDPSPLYWDALRRRIGDGLVDVPAAGPVRARFQPLFAGALVAAAVVAGAVLLPLRTLAPSSPAATAAASALPAWSALPEEDPSLEVLGALEAQMADAVPTTECHDWAKCVAGLDEDDSRALAVALRNELGAEGAL